MNQQTRWILPAAALLATVATAACNRGEPADKGQPPTLASGTSVAAPDTALVHQNAVLQAQKDSLFGATRSLLTAMASIDSATSLAGVKPKDRGEPIVSYEEGVRARTVEALRSLRTTRARLRDINTRIADLGGQNSELKTQVDQLRSTVSALQTQLTSSQVRADSLVRRLYAANIRGDSLDYRTKQLGYTIDSTAYENRRVFVATGTPTYLVKHGIANEVGGTRFPFIVRIGQTLRPANVHPDTTLFRAFDMMALETVPVDSTRPHEVISQQDLTAADHTDLHGRTFTGAIHITDPKRFWRGSPYLILVEP